MKSLEDAIYSKFTSTSAITTAIPGGLSAEEAPEGTVFPHMVYQVLASPLDEGFSNWKRYTATIPFTLYGPNSASLETAFKTFTDVFDDIVLTLSGNLNFDTRRIDEPICQKAKDESGEQIKDEQQQVIYRIDSTYQFSVA